MQTRVIQILVEHTLVEQTAIHGIDTGTKQTDRGQTILDDQVYKHTDRLVVLGNDRQLHIDTDSKIDIDTCTYSIPRDTVHTDRYNSTD